MSVQTNPINEPDTAENGTPAAWEDSNSNSETEPNIQKVNERKREKLANLAGYTFMALLALFYFLGSPLISKDLYYMLLFHPVAYPQGHYENNVVNGIKAKDLFVKTADNKLLHAWYFHKPQSKCLLLMHHGNGGNLSILQWYVDIALQSNASIIVYDYEGYGRSSGKPCIDAACRDSEIMFDYATKQLGWRDQQIVNLGLSLGTGVASELSQKRNSAGTILIAPFTNIRRVAASVLPWLPLYPDLLWAEHDLGSTSLLLQDHNPVLILHGDEDTVVLFQHAIDLKESSKGSAELVKLHCGHGDLRRVKDQIQSSIRKFIEENVS